VELCCRLAGHAFFNEARRPSAKGRVRGISKQGSTGKAYDAQQNGHPLHDRTSTLLQNFPFLAADSGSGLRCFWLSTLVSRSSVSPTRDSDPLRFVGGTRILPTSRV
jgi:hypothetical protein